MTTVEPQYKFLQDLDSQGQRQNFGLMSSGTWLQDPKRLGFVLSRYKFVSRMLEGMNSVLEVGCADAFGSRVVRQSVGSLLATDIDPIFIADAKRTMAPQWPIDFMVHDFLFGPLSEQFEAAFALDVLEHIPPDSEHRFLENIARSLQVDGVAVLGMPSLESQNYASKASREGHVNCQSGEQLRETLGQHFARVFMFSMNDEVVHTGFFPMAHYLIGVCVGPSTRSSASEAGRDSA